MLVCLSFQPSLFAENAFRQHAITIKTDEKSLINNIYAYSIAKWLSYKYNVSFYAQAFVESENFSIETEDNLLKPDIASSFTNTVDISSEDELIKSLYIYNKPTLFTVGRQTTLHFAPSLVETIHWPDPMTNFFFHTAMHAPLEKSLHKSLSPKNEYTTQELPYDKITVAVYVRKGTAENLPLVSIQYNDEWDQFIAKKVLKPFFAKGSDFLQPLQFPPEQFYVDQIIKLSAMFYDTPMHVCVFTDDKKPEKIVARLQARINKTNIAFTYNQHSQSDSELLSMLNDIHLMAQYDCLIRPQSDVAFIAQLVGNHKIVMWPQTTMGKMEQLLNQVMIVVDNVTIFFHNRRTHFIKCCECNVVTDSHKQCAMMAIKS